MKTGKVTYWNRERHYGFIRCDDGSADQFVDGSALRGTDTLYVGDTVLFEVARDRQRHRERAVNVIVQTSPLPVAPVGVARVSAFVASLAPKDVKL